MATNIVVAKYVSGLMVKIHNIPHIKWIRSVHVTYIHQPEANPFKQFKMATEKSFEFVVLSELNLPEDLFSMLKGQNYDLSTLMHVSKDQLAETLSETQCSSGQIWNIEEIFRRIICWRQENDFDIIEFAGVDVEESWLDSEDPVLPDGQDTVSPEQHPATSDEQNATPPVAQDSVCLSAIYPVKPEVQSAVQDSDCPAAQYPIKTDPPQGTQVVSGVQVSLVHPGARYIVQPSLDVQIVSSPLVPNVPVASGDQDQNQSQKFYRKVEEFPEVRDSLCNQYNRKLDDPKSVGIDTAGLLVSKLANKSTADTPKKSTSTDNPVSGTSSSTVASPAVPNVSLKNVASEKNPDDCLSCLKHFSPKTLLRLLGSTVTGKHLLERGVLGPLSKDSQKELVAIIADYHCQKGAETTERVIEEYVDSIKALFKSEHKDTYFIGRGGLKKNPGGKLYNRIVNLKQKTAKRKWKEEEHLNQNGKEMVPPVIDNKAAAEAVAWLQQNSEPWSTTLDKWTISFPLRKSFLGKADNRSKLSNELQHYRHEFGYQLIDIDFHLLNVGDREGWKKWERLLPKIVEYVKKPFKEEPSKFAVDLLKSPNASQCQQICAVLLLLNNFLTPTKVTRTFKPSVLLAQEEIISFAVTDEEAFEKVRNLNTMYSSYGIPSIARLVFRGQNLQSLNGVFEVHYEGISYRLDTAAKAIDVLVKYNNVFGLQFSRISRLVWNFVCSHIYDIPIQEQYECINKLKRYLKDV